MNLPNIKWKKKFSRPTYEIYFTISKLTHIKYKCCLKFHELSLELLAVAVSLKTRAKKRQISPQFINLLSLQRNRNSRLKSEKKVPLA